MLVFSVDSQSKSLSRLGCESHGRIGVQAIQGAATWRSRPAVFPGGGGHLNECTCVCPRLIVSIPSCRVRVCGEALLFVTSQPSPFLSMLFCPPTLFFVNHFIHGKFMITAHNIELHPYVRVTAFTAVGASNCVPIWDFMHLAS